MLVGVSLIISVYKNTLFLKTILDALQYQTVIPDEVVVSEDGNSPEMRDFLASYPTQRFNIVHLAQADEGWRKNKALNRAIVAASHSYLIFIDGDCVLHTRFVENHLRLANPHHILAGKRIKLGPRFSERLLRTPLPKFQNGLFWRIPSMLKDGAKFVEEVVYISLNGLTRKVVSRLGISAIKGCNFSCYKDTIMAINGFDEDYKLPAVGEDIDLVWRFQGLGYRIVSVRHFAVQYHLHHSESWMSQEKNFALLHAKQASRQFRCLNGISKQPPQRKVVYTAIFGNYEGLLPQKKIAGWDFVCFTDDKSLSAAPWTVKLMEQPIPGDPVRSSRYIKINPHLFLDQYDISIFIDGNFLIIGDINKLVETMLSDAVIACFDHAQNTRDPRSCIYEEYASIKQIAEKLGTHKDDPQVMQRQVDLLKAEGYPEENGLVYSGVLLRRHNDSGLIRVMRDWWYMVQHYSRRDQLSFDYVMWKHGIRYRIIPGDSRRDNGYFYMLGKHRRDWSSKLWKFRLKKLLGLIKTNG